MGVSMAEPINDKRRASDRRACYRKIRYKKKAAKAALERMLIQKPAKDTLYLTIYECSECGGWHLGNSKNKQGKLGTFKTGVEHG